MKKYLMYGTLSIALIESFIITQNVQAQNLFDTVSSNISGSSGPVSGTVSDSGASGTVSAAGNSVSSNITSSGATSANVSGLVSSTDGDGV